MDLVEQYGKLTHNLEAYTDVYDLRYLLEAEDESELERNPAGP